jgi:Immune inhibitor A peptidase M6
MISLKETRRLLESTRLWNSAFALTLLVPTLWIVGCATDNSTSLSTTASSSTGSQGGGGGSTSSTGTGGEGGAGGAVDWPCGQDCSKIDTKNPCHVAVCNEGQLIGPVGACTVVPANVGTTCDDGLFCTANDTCDIKGDCQGGPQNDCGLTPPICTTTTCDETSKSCGTAPADEGSSCAAPGACEVNGACHSGQCTGEPKDCSFSPQSECNVMTCNPDTGNCEPTPDATKNGNKCLLTGDLCKVNRSCTDGQCGGGTPKDCSAMTHGCTVGTCNTINGSCDPKPVPAGGECFDNITACHVGICDANAACTSTALADGTACNDNNSCTSGDVCSSGTCMGMSTTGCLVYMEESFESCPAGWTLAGDWQCGTPTTVGPATAHTGNGCIATQIHGKYSNNQNFDTAVATSPPISLVSATSPILSFWTWINTEGSDYDGFNLKISTDGGANFTQVTTVSPAYSLEIDSESAWGGDMSSLGWQNFTADLSAYVGKQILLRFAFASDISGTYPGVYIDDVTVAEQAAVQLTITSAPTLANTFTTLPYAQQIKKSGGSSASAWSIVAGTNHGWLSIDPASGLLAGTPTAANIGPVSVTVHVEEPTLPSNFAEQTFTFTVADVGALVFNADFEGPCPNGWTLTGDWQCGTPSVVGPSTAYSGTQCLATKLASNYSTDQLWANTTATSPDIDLTTAVGPKLSFRMYIDTEGSTFDGANLKISTNGGSTYSIVNNVVPAYTLSVDGQPAWGGHQGSAGWQLVQADLSAYVGQTIRLRIAFSSDDIVTYPGVYIDDVKVIGN